MLNPFPDLLMPFVAPTLLRVGMAVVFVAVAWMQFNNREQIAQVSLPVIGRQAWWGWISIAVHICTAVSLFLGAYVQIAALVGALLGLKHAFWSRTYPALFPLGSAAGLLVMLVCLSLVVSGAGAFGKDLPL